MSYLAIILLLVPIWYFERLDGPTQERVLAGLAILAVLAFAGWRLRNFIRRVTRPLKPVFLIAAWEARYTAQDFQSGFTSYVQSRGYQVLWFRILDTDKVALTIEKHRHKVLLLCLRDGTSIRDGDRTILARLRAEHEPHRACIVLPALQQTATATPGADRLTYADLPAGLA